MSQTSTSEAKNTRARFVAFCSDTFWEIKKDFYSKNNKTTLLLYFALSGLLLIMFLVLLFSFLSFPTTIAGVLARISLISPFVWLASHVNSIINRRNKLYIEYEHKERVIEFYVAFKDEIKKNDKIREAFAKAITDVILRFPSIIGEAQESDSPIDKILKTFKEKYKKSPEKPTEE